MPQWYWEKQSRNYLGKLEFLISVAHQNEKDVSRIFSSLFLEENSAHHTKATCQRKRLVELTVSEGASIMAGAIAGSSRHGCRGWCLRTLIPNYKHTVEKERIVRWVRQCPPTITHFLQQSFYQGWPSIHVWGTLLIQTTPTNFSFPPSQLPWPLSNLSLFFNHYDWLMLSTCTSLWEYPLEQFQQ